MTVNSERGKERGQRKSKHGDSKSRNRRSSHQLGGGGVASPGTAVEYRRVWKDGEAGKLEGNKESFLRE